MEDAGQQLASGSLDRRLAALSLEEAQIIGARIALSAIPLLVLGGDVEPKFENDILSTFRVVSAAWTAATFRTGAGDRFDIDAAFVGGGFGIGPYGVGPYGDSLIGRAMPGRDVLNEVGQRFVDIATAISRQWLRRPPLCRQTFQTL
jgi:hypothetical protein